MKALILFLLISVNSTLSENILYLHNVLSPSHHLWNRVLAKELANRGHNVTFLSVDKPIGDTKNLHYIVLENTYELFQSGSSETSLDLIKLSEASNSNKLYGAKAVVEFCIPNCKAIMQAEKGIDKILNYPNNFKFDLVINDFTCGPCLIPLIHKFNYPPTIGVTAFLNPPFTDLTIGGHKYPAYVPHFIINFPQIMSFSQRLYNFLLYSIEKL